jgi:hypothetical protein
MSLDAKLTTTVPDTLVVHLDIKDRALDGTVLIQ